MVFIHRIWLRMGSGAAFLQFVEAARMSSSGGACLMMDVYRSAETEEHEQFVVVSKWDEYSVTGPMQEAQTWLEDIIRAMGSSAVVHTERSAHLLAVSRVPDMSLIDYYSSKLPSGRTELHAMRVSGS